MDAQHIGADDPDDRAAFNAIVAGLDIDTTDQPDQSPKKPAHTDRTLSQEPVDTAPAPQHQPTQPVQAPAPPQPQLPKEPSPPNYWGAKGLSVVYWIAILTGGIGQVTFFGSKFDMGLAGYLAAAVIATTFETVMVASGDTALTFRVQGRSRHQWVPFLVIGFIAAAAASWMNVDHFWSDSTALALLFGGVAALGFVLHILDGMVKGSDYIEAKSTYDAELERQRRKTEARVDAEYERQLADRESTRQAAHRARTEVEQNTPTTPKPATGTGQRKRATTKTAKSQPSRDEVVAWSAANGHPGPSAVAKHFTSQGYQLGVSTARRWINGK